MWWWISVALLCTVLYVNRRSVGKIAFKIGYWLYTTRLGYFLHVHALANSKDVMEHNSRSVWCMFGNFHVVSIPILTDNFAYLIIDDATKCGALVDPADPSRCADIIGQLGVSLTHVLTTHKHWDHAGGNETICTLFPDVKIVGSAKDDVLCANMVVSDGDELVVGASTRVRVLSAPGHTRGHIMFHASNSNSNDNYACQFMPNTDTNELFDTRNESLSAGAIFTGDVLFSGGCGRFFEGDATQVQHTFDRLVQKLPSDTLMFCGHEYTCANLDFACWIEPSNRACHERLSWAKEQVADRRSTIPSTLGEEQQFNPFLRSHIIRADKSSPLQAHLGGVGGDAHTNAHILQKIRDLKNAHKVRSQ